MHACLQRLLFRKENGLSAKVYSHEIYPLYGSLQAQSTFDLCSPPPPVMGSVSSTAPSLEPYIAHYMDTYLESRRLVVVDGPTEDSVAKWWQMVWDEDVAYVVNMTPQDEEVSG